MIVAAIGVALLAYGIIKWMDVGDKADDLQAAFGQAVAGGAMLVASEVTLSVGFLVLIVGTVLVTFAGAKGRMGGSEDQFRCTRMLRWAAAAAHQRVTATRRPMIPNSRDLASRRVAAPRFRIHPR